MSQSLGEYHELYGDIEEWKDEKEKVSKLMDRALENIETDNYEDAVRQINGLIIRLGTWKSKLSKTL